MKDKTLAQEMCDIAYGIDTAARKFREGKSEAQLVKILEKIKELANIGSFRYYHDIRETLNGKCEIDFDYIQNRLHKEFGFKTCIVEADGCMEISWLPGDINWK